MRFGAWTVAAACAMALAACGGGGGGSSGGGGGSGKPNEGDLLVSVNYDGGFSLFQQGTVAPALSGFDGNAPACTLASGTLPPGVQLQGNCTLTGRPTAAGPYSFTVRVTVAGFAGAVDFSDSVWVASPTITYEGHAGYRQELPLNAPVNDLPQLSGWTPAAGDTTSWSYALRGGTLAPGLTLDPSTGAITGMVTAQGSFTASIQARLVTPYGSHDAAPSSYSVNVNVPTFEWFNFGDTNAAGDFRAYLGRPYNVVGARTPDTGTLSDFRLGAGATLPAGLSLNAGTGNITGTPTTVTAPQVIPIEATITIGAVANTTTANLRLEVVAPGYLEYATGLVGQVGTALEHNTSWVDVDGSFFGPIQRTATQRAGACTLPPGVAMHPANGQMTGTPTAGGSYDCVVDFEITVNGVTWTQPAQYRIQVN